MAGRPRSKKIGLSAEWVDGELVIYDETTQMAHCLSSDAAKVFEHCDGESSEVEIAVELGMDPRAMQRALEHLAQSGLVESYAGYSRRDFAKGFAKVGGAAFAAPLIYSVAVPTAAAAASCPTGTTRCGTVNCCSDTTQHCCNTTCCNATGNGVGCAGASCNANSKCCSGVCITGTCVGP